MGGNYLQSDTLHWKPSRKEIKTARYKVDIFEYLNSLGWQLVSAYSIVLENTPTIYYIFKKEM